MLAVIYGLKHIAQNGAGWLPALAILAGIAVGCVFVRRQKTLADPLIDLRLFEVRAFSASLATNILAFLVMFSAFLYIAQYLQLVIGLSPIMAGLWSLPSACAFIAGSMLTPMIVRHARTVHVMVAGLVIAAIGFGIVTQIGGTSSLATLVTGSFLLSLGLTPVVTLTTDMVVGAAPPERAGAAASLSETATEFGGALGIAVFGSIGTAGLSQQGRHPRRSHAGVGDLGAGYARGSGCSGAGVTRGNGGSVARIRPAVRSPSVSRSRPPSVSSS